MAEQRVQRRLAAILAADVVGYSRLVEADEEATVRTLSTYREIIEGLIATHQFARPVEAVRCAADIQRELEAHNVDLPEDRRMRLRIGVNLGDVIVEGDNLLGDGVNIAARLETLADPGGISIRPPFRLPFLGLRSFVRSSRPSASSLASRNYAMYYTSRIPVSFKRFSRRDNRPVNSS